jgi:hypothetical protein
MKPDATAPPVCTPAGEKGKQVPVPGVKSAGGTPAVRKAKASNVRRRREYFCTAKSVIIRAADF